MKKHNHALGYSFTILFAVIVAYTVSGIFSIWADNRIIDYICERDPDPAACTEELR